MADSLSEVLPMLGRGGIVVGRTVDADGCEQEDVLFLPSWRVRDLKAIGMGKYMRYEFSKNTNEMA